MDKIKTQKRAYSELYSHPMWSRIDRAIDRLVANNDLVETTARYLIVGFILKACLGRDNSHKDLGYTTKEKSPKKIMKKDKAGGKGRVRKTTNSKDGEKNLKSKRRQPSRPA